MIKAKLSKCNTKTADVISNVSELLDDYARDKEAVFKRFNASKADTIANHKAVIKALINRWNDKAGKVSDNPMMADIKTLTDDLENL